METHYIGLMIACWALLTLCVAVRCSPVYPNTNDSTYSKVESICADRPERFIESDGKESSLILDFKSGQTDQDLCMRILSAPESYGFIVRLIRPKLRKSFHNAHAGPLAELNTTRACPLRIFTSLDPLIPSWEVDPCQLEDSSMDIEDPVKLFQGRLRLVWDHRGQTISSKLMVTVLGKGDACQEPNKHPCLKIGIEPLLCISKDLVCDGIRHCPNSNEYDSDEDYATCWKSKKSDYGAQIDFEAFRNLFAFDVLPPEAGLNNTTNILDNGGGNISYKNNSSPTGYTRRNSTRLGLNSDLSKYGPWGYLMLGMLLCGGALLICGLWECCYRINKSDHTITASASQSAHNDPDAAIQPANVTVEHNSTPPNYEELDPPPSYSVLFPNQKAVTTESGSPSTVTTTTLTGTSSDPNTISASTTIANTSS